VPIGMRAQVKSEGARSSFGSLACFFTYG